VEGKKLRICPLQGHWQKLNWVDGFGDIQAVMFDESPKSSSLWCQQSSRHGQDPLGPKGRYVVIERQ
jgi:hypothetical protein